MSEGQNGKGNEPNNHRNFKKWNDNYDAIDFSKTKTSAEWLAEKYKGTIILDPDGWDRSNFDFSFNEEQISFSEFERRLCYSTIKLNKKT